MTASILKLTNIKVKSARQTILAIDTLEVRSGEFIGIIGTNGAGKTTLLNLCCGILTPSQGTIEIVGSDLAALTKWQKTNLRKQISYIPQSTEYNSELPFTLREVVAMGRTSTKSLVTGLNKKDYDLIDYWIDKLGLTKKRHQTFRSLSGGEQQKALIARAMAQKPTILMLDEPCANLDFNWKHQITQIIEQLYFQGKMTVLMVSHETNLLPACCKRVVLLDNGQILADDSAEKILSSELLEQAYRCRIETVNIHGRTYTISRN
ncbi:MAG: ABC transporter ATP-binding protein [Sedimentisphaerales bacterium]|nr:ABC transporter ATP-binding protein [Sedimentisphaerales bacterium]